MKLPKQLAAFFSHPAPDRERMTTLQYMAELICINNGDSEVTKVGSYEKSDNKFGRIGLTPIEALHLTQMINFMKGILFALGSPELEFDILQFVRREVQHTASGSTVYIPTGQEINTYG